MAGTEEIKNQIVDNQKIIDQLNADLNRKTQEVKIIQEISSEINATLDLDVILQKMLQSLDKTFDFKYSMVLLMKNEEELEVAASYGYDNRGIGAVVKVGEGIIGVVAKRKKLVRMGNIGSQMSYMNAVKNNVDAQDESRVKLPGLANVQSQVAIPMLLENKLVGVLAVESPNVNVFDKRDEVIVSILANQAANAIDKAQAHLSLKLLNESLEEKVKDRTAEIEMQKVELQEINDEILDSIRYAKRLQDTLLPPKKYMDEHIGEYFVLFRPKDIVSGDFYWVNHKEDNLFIAAVDCTGHGVPGAFVSLIAHGGLQRSIHVFNFREPRYFLDKLNEAIADGFNKHGDGDIRDGMDIALYNLNRSKMELTFAGANNPLYIIRKGELIVLESDKQPIGLFENAQPFTQQTIKVEKGDCIYAFSDGYADQFGGPRNKKFKYSRFKELLLKINKKPMTEQNEILEKEFYDWMGSNNQTDDVCVIGVRV